MRAIWKHAGSVPQAPRLEAYHFRARSTSFYASIWEVICFHLEYAPYSIHREPPVVALVAEGRTTEFNPSPLLQLSIHDNQHHLLFFREETNGIQSRARQRIVSSYC
ncbi:hypothetical protein GCK72_013118 [Caenorhabditis remanei]|uniref:Uncharacterized protein n=1 Tax=Caenorhabditis remanei TaxID=31234 RepID=A0A6A5GPV3_CAERE|nr:hypothetical protein GCK72_013118 [Caenorhabditis remanei]KAF1756664.1 hypothetical protein GCK72_013118 [Caenorhabditis remanei]